MSDSPGAIVPLRSIASAVLRVDPQSVRGVPPQDVAERVRSALVSKLGAIAETCGEDLNPDCVHVTERRAADGFREYTGRWMPAPDAPCDLLGGSSDGVHLTSTRTASDGLPERVLMMGPPEPVNGNVFANSQAYTLVGFRNDTVRWIYRA